MATNPTENAPARENEDFQGLFYRAQIDFMMLFIRTLIILNSGALVSVLLAISRSESDRIFNVLIDNASHFWWGLMFCLVGFVFCSPITDELQKFVDIPKAKISLLAVGSLMLLLSLTFLLVGIYQSISGLDALLPSQI